MALIVIKICQVTKYNINRLCYGHWSSHVVERKNKNKTTILYLIVLSLFRCQIEKEREYELRRYHINLPHYFEQYRLQLSPSHMYPFHTGHLLVNICAECLLIVCTYLSWPYQQLSLICHTFYQLLIILYRMGYVSFKHSSNNPFIVLL